VNFSRTLKHLFSTHWALRRAFPAAALATIEAAVREAEQGHNGQIRVVLEAALPAEALWHDQSARSRAIEVFSRLRVWDTEHNNGVLIYLLFADHVVEIVADRGIAARVPDEEWESVCRDMERAFKDRRFQAGLVSGIGAVAEHLAAHFPAREQGGNELPDKPLLL
jgi:uncharacterized membrane protein